MGAANASWNAATLQVGDIVDVRDTLGEWNEGSVVATTDATVTIKYKGWADRYNEAIARDSKK
jgi:hypothetical protein